MTLTAGTRLGSYEIGAPLGRGGVGEVYRAWDPRLEREVALKILHERSEVDPDRVWRFVAEARAASALNHPNILTVFDAAVDGATPFIVSELIEGDSLRGEIRRGPVPIKRLLDLATQIADGLAEAHAAGIVHRDLKPENIMVTPAGRAKILDFGLSRTTGLQTPGVAPVDLDGQTQTEAGLLIGTVPYMSPEQARGSPTDFRSDQFSFGLILYEMATGVPAFRRESPAATLQAIINDEPPPLPDVQPNAPLLLWWIVERCLAKAPADRYGVTSDLHRDLRNLRDRLADAVARERRAPAEPPPRSKARRALLPAALAGAAAVGALLWASMAGRQPVDDDALRFAPFATEAEYEGLPAWSPDGQTIAYAAEVRGVLQIFTRTLASPAPAQLTDAAFDCKYPFWSPDGKRIYYVSLARTRDGLYSVGAAGGTPQLVVENVSRGAISPDGRTLAFLRDEQEGYIVGTEALYLATPQGAEPWSSEAVEAAARKYDEFGELRFVEGALQFSPDGRVLGLCAAASPFNIVQTEARGVRFWIVPVEGGPPVRRLGSWADTVPRISSFTWLPDSRHVVLGAATVSTPGTHLWMADMDADRVWPLTRSADSESYPSASPAGDRLVFIRGEPDYDVAELPVTGGSPTPLIETARNESDPALSPDGALLAYVTDRSGQEEIWLRNMRGQSFDRPLITQEGFTDGRNIMLAAPSFSPNGQQIAYLRTGGAPIVPLQIYTSMTAGGPPVRLLPATHESYQGAPTWSPDGRWIAFADWKDRHWGLVKVRVGSAEAPIVLRTDGVSSAAPRWSPNGDWITWETDAGFVLVSPDGVEPRTLDLDDPWVVHAWSRDGSEVLGVIETEGRRLAMVGVSAASGRVRTIADLGPSPPVNNPVKGFDVTADGGTILTSFVRMRGDLWLLEGLRRPEGVWLRLFPGESATVRMKTP